MTLSKLEIQQMLREMNVKFDADDTYEDLKARLQQENHSLWLKSVAGPRGPQTGRGTIRVRKRKKSDDTNEPVPAAPAAEHIDAAGKKSPKSAHSRRVDHPFRPHPIDKPEPGKPWKTVADGVEPFNRKKNVFESVLRRAGRCCERCGAPASERSADNALVPYHIQPLTEGGEHSIKNVVAICPLCRDALEKDPSAKDIKELKRKTRSKLYDALQVIQKKTIRSKPRPSSDRRK